jgi:hypothetical protein
MKKLVNRNDGVYFDYKKGFKIQQNSQPLHSFAGLKQFMVHLAQVVESLALFDFELQGGLNDINQFNVFSSTKPGQQLNS